MKKYYALVVVVLLLFSTSCKKEEKQPDQSKQHPIVGKWILTNVLYTEYEDGRLKIKDRQEELPLKLNIVEYKSDGTGRSQLNENTSYYTLFDYVISDTALITKNYRVYDGDRLIPGSYPTYTSSIKELKGDKWTVYTEASFEEWNGTKTVTVRKINKNTLSRLK
ncbi:hypothetical protein [Mucilaginibacter defluvii]|uniref:Lipocalin-like protein n=1 Tax=Mucilaginibacter defluvii TaxID=1196019 RepID=A0ABP9FTD8_9SPHI